ncbi:MAG: amidohydrolase family protein, partial [Flammeovirgaceae bacterium]
MKLKLITLLFLSLLCSCATKHNDNSITFKGDHISNDFSILLSDINIVSVNENKVFPHKNVLIESGEIKQILDREELEHFAADRIINGKGKYLLAGLADMHTHLGVELDTASQIGKLEALQFLNNGVTTILNLGDFLETINDNAIFQLKDKILANKEIGPYIYTALYAREQGNGQLHQQVNSFEDGVKFVEEVEKSDYDLVKIYTFTPQEAVKGILKESTKRNIGVAGHLSRPAKLKTLISKNGIDLIAHTSEILYTFCNAKG